VKFAVDLPNFDPCADARTLADLARDAEQAGWDGVFLWDHVTFGAEGPGMADPWIALTAIAMNTERVKLGPMVTPLPRRRPWKVAREAVSLDRLSGGRLVLGVGIGGDTGEWADFGEEADIRKRGEMLDEGLEILTGLWSGRPFSFHGEHYTLTGTTFTPVPLQEPRIPIWVAASWPKKKPFRRAARWDGVFPMSLNAGYDMMSAEEMKEAVRYTREQRDDDRRFDVAHFGMTPGNDAAEDAAIVAPYAEAGVTWWLENIVPMRWSDEEGTALEVMRRRILQGPPALKEGA
jgi:probable F420-dependent oxidoreductase